MKKEFDYLRGNLELVMSKIEKAALKSGRKADSVKVIAVTKTVEPEKISAMLDEGITDLGENRVQELTKKYDIINKECNWHHIGHLQSNKVKYIVDKVKLIHSVDRLSLASEIQKRAQKAGTIIDVLVQVNVSREESKFGVYKEQLLELLKKISTFDSMRVRGLMTMAPYDENPENIRYVFSNLKDLSIDIQQKKLDNISMEFLSMGMSNDYEVAIEEGANMVRIGTALFGKRD
ncbi:YggS family pyridoxal phosphate-dependent enzyme [Herbivorax sp. ANBcel31]|uniref:YggS family pyridoxal phosphate-dependent enzyme n=1 Tax=Herbivorax sp. ANBcel31 TaxID=3069754 RepID=UPI0027B5C18E|nr:YggS family pyridoxal phosphate-dependent enzyme [Herbivorax sp. ANBcel31]MDQ2086621.1 YggS family pyridoxal phosphate-dependent enzyme [Herbivorax sp. ANBcel31]